MCEKLVIKKRVTYFISY